MKIFKISLIGYVALGLLYGISVLAAKTVPSYGYVGVIASVTQNNEVQMDTYTKGYDFHVQAYDFQGATTTLNSNCTNCRFRVTLFRSDGNWVNYRIGKTGNKYYLDSMYNQTSSAPGDYYLKIKREDVTLLNSTHFGDWYVTTNLSGATY